MKTHNTLSLKICLVAFFCLAHVNIAGAVSERQILTLEAAENIAYVSQQIAKAYFYKQLGIRIAHARKDLKNGMASLDSDIKILTAGATDEEVKNVLLFVSFTRDELKSTIAQPYSKENGALMLDFSESLLEGAELIANKHTRKKDAKEAMLIVVARMSFLLERINKYYIAHKAGFKDHNNVVQLEVAIKEFEADLAKVNSYHYPASLQSSTDKINKFWPIAKRFYIGIEKGALPVIVMSSTDNLKKVLKKLEKHHKKTALK